MAIKPEDMELVVKMIRGEIKAFAKNADAIVMSELAELAQAMDASSVNIAKLQAQITALKEVLIQKGLVSRQALFEKENEALEKIQESIRAAQKVKPQSEAGASKVPTGVGG